MRIAWVFGFPNLPWDLARMVAGECIAPRWHGNREIAELAYKPAKIAKS
jgi:hypothetical protein